MSVIKSISGVFHLRKRPAPYTAVGAAYRTGGNKGYYLASFPKTYPRTRQQRKVAEVAQACGIVRGMSKAALQRAMVECVKPRMMGSG